MELVTTHKNRSGLIMKNFNRQLACSFLAVLFITFAHGFVPNHCPSPLSRKVATAPSSSTEINGFLDDIGNNFKEMMQDLDDFVDDATARRLGAGSAFYGKRKSKFYGKNDSGRKKDPNMPDPTEDYQGPTSSGMFEWRPDENGQLRPVTRGRNINIERNPNFWDRVYKEEE